MTDRKDDRYTHTNTNLERQEGREQTQEEIDRYQKDKQGLKTVADHRPLSPLHYNTY